MVSCGVSKKAVAIVGSSGYIASHIVKRLNTAGDNDVRVLRIDLPETGAEYPLRLSEAGSFDYEALTGVELVVFTAAVSSPDKCADSFDECFEINVTGTARFIREALKRNCRVLFFSSDAVYENGPGMIFDESSKTAPASPYGKMKKAVEDEFSSEAKFKAIRLSYVVSAKDKFVAYCLDCLRNASTASVFHPFYRNCVSVSDVVDTVMWFLAHWEKYPYPVLNVAGTELVSRIRIADEINRIAGGRLRYEIVSPNEEFFKNRQKITQMKSIYASKYGIYPQLSFSEKIQKELEGVLL